MIDTLLLFAPSYCATLGIGLVCAYLGLFCVMRRIVFTGVALAQLAAAGVAASFFLADTVGGAVGRVASAWGSTAGSLGLSVLGALGLHLRRGARRVTSDAAVGLAYSAAAALAVLLVWRSSRGLAELKNILAGEVLLSRSDELVALAIGCGLVALVHARYRRVFLLVSFDPEFAQSLGLPERRYQLLFLATLAVAVALALKVGGVLLVFSLLVLPPVAGLVLGEGLTEATLVALAVASGAALLGFLAAIGGDLPVAPTVAAAHLPLVGLAGLGRLHRHAGRAVRVVIGLLAAAALLTAPALLLGAWLDREPAPPPGPDLVASPEPSPHVDHHAGPHAHDEEEGDDQARREAIRALREAPEAAARRQAARRLGRLGGEGALRALLEGLLDTDVAVREAAADAIALLARAPATRDHLEHLLETKDAEQRVCAAFACMHMGHPDGIEVLVEALDDPDVSLLLKEDVLVHLREVTGGEDFGYDPFAEAEANAEAVAAWEAWWEERGRHLRWDAEAEAFR